MVLLGAVATVVAVGAGASAFGPSRSEVVTFELDAQRAVDTSGANASPGPTPVVPSPTPSKAPTGVSRPAARLPRDHHIPPQHSDRLARRREDAVDHDRLRDHGQALRPPAGHV